MISRGMTDSPEIRLRVSSYDRDEMISYAIKHRARYHVRVRYRTALAAIYLALRRCRTPRYLAPRRCRGRDIRLRRGSTTPYLGEGISLLFFIRFHTTVSYMILETSDITRQKRPLIEKGAEESVKKVDRVESVGVVIPDISRAPRSGAN
jgi:hypothetical protein